MSHQQPTGVVVVEASPEPNMLMRVIWFLFVGWWLSGWAVLLAIVLQLTLIGIPAAVWLVNRIPQIMTLKSSRKLRVTGSESGVTVIGHADRLQRAWWIRTIYYVLVGWWATSFWMALAWLASITLLLMPLGFGCTGRRARSRRSATSCRNLRSATRFSEARCPAQAPALS